MLSEKAIKDFKQIWSEEVGENISDDFATQEARKLLELFDKIYCPIRKIQMENLGKGNQDKKLL